MIEQAARVQRLVALVMIALGFVLVAVGVIGTVLDKNGAPEGDRMVAEEPTAEPTESPPAEAPPPEETPPPETPQEFFEAFTPAVRESDADFLFQRLHPAVFELYGRPQCRRRVSALGDPTATFEVLRVRGPGVFNWAIDEREVRVENVFTVTVDVTQGGQTNRQPIHLGIVNDELRWFTDCGDPV